MRATIRRVAGQVKTPAALSKVGESKVDSQLRAECVKLARHGRDATPSRGCAALEIETPSWGYGNSGTRFHVFPWPGAARDVRERIADAALVHRLTGCCPTVALHIPWDRVDDWGALRRFAEEQGVRIGAINPNLFGDDDVPPRQPLPPRRAPCARRRSSTAASASRSPQELGSTAISLWLADGTNYPGQDDLRPRYARLTGGPRGALRAAARGMGCSSSTSSSSRPSTAPTCPTGAPRR